MTALICIAFLVLWIFYLCREESVAETGKAIACILGIGLLAMLCTWVFSAVLCKGEGW